MIRRISIDHYFENFKILKLSKRTEYFNLIIYFNYEIKIRVDYCFKEIEFVFSPNFPVSIKNIIHKYILN